jgi:ubiquitin-protein ligase
LIWITLCAFDDRYYPVSLTTSEIRKIETPTHDKILKVKKRKAKYENDTSNGVGFASHPCIHFDASHYQEQARKKSDAGATRARKVQVDDDIFGSMVLKLLASLLPVLTGGTNFDDEPPGAVLDLLLKSKVLEYSAALLRNDSLDDVSARLIVYEDLFKLVSSLHEHHTTSELVYNHRLVRSNKCNLLSLSFQDISGVPDDERESIFNSLRNLATQSSLVVQHAHKKDFNTRDEQGLVKLARRIDELWQLLTVNNPERTVKPTKNNATQSEAKAVPITDVPDKDILASHYFKKKANALKDASLGRMKRLITEVTTLTTGLPPGIYVRYGSDRPDVMKAIIIGPVGTPYENGIFEFDIFCDAHFPNTSPQVRFKTTGGGSASFNPNLYDNGQVCLSLLGTWVGEPWNPNQSTLLQVLVSIQAMILCEEPWYNEPGKVI